MASSLLALLDDITVVLDDVAVMTKLATKKTAGVLGDDLALNAEQVTGVKPDRELPVVWAVTKGSALNKVILVPAALGLTAVAPWLLTPLLMLGGAFLCYEGVEKLAHKFLTDPEQDAKHREARLEAMAKPEVDMVEFEKDKIKGAIRTDFILSAEIVVISLGAIGDVSLGMKAAVLTAIAVVTTVGIYGLVAGIVKLDDAGTALAKRESSLARGLGWGLLRGAPLLMRLLSIVGTAAMFLVGGGIISHGVALLKSWSAAFEAMMGGVGGIGGVLGYLAPALFDGTVGLVLGAVILGVVSAGGRLFAREPSQA